jgi:N-methylhydantoinase A
VFFAAEGEVEADVLWFDELRVATVVRGPAIIESDFTTVVVNPGASATRAPSGSLILIPRVAGQSVATQLEGSVA